MDFEKLHAAWLADHLRRRKGERRGRLERGHQHGEKLFAQNVWVPLRGNLDGLHPEYEVLDWRGRSYFADFCFILGGYLRLLIEIKGYNTHVRDKDRKGHCSECNRETFLQSIGYRVLSFAYDDVEERPELCITLLRMFLSQFQPRELPAARKFVGEDETIRLAFSLARPIRPIDVTDHLRVNRRTAVAMLQELCAKGWFSPVRSGNRVMRYELVKKNYLEER